MNSIDILEEKEKKAYDNLIMLKYFTMEKEDKESIDIILKLVKTLIAENKELKEEKEELKRENREIRNWKYTIDTYEDLDLLKRLDIIKIKGKEYIDKNLYDELKKDKKALINNYSKVLGEFISKDKIKAKIEEVEQWGLYNMKIPKLSTLDERLGAKIGIKYVLQSLLGKE